MKLALFTNYLNHHQSSLADEFYRRLGNQFIFIATMPPKVEELKGGADYSTRKYCLLAATSSENRERALKIAADAEICIFGACSQIYAVYRAKHNPSGLSFECGERWLKRGLFNIFSPTLLKWRWNYMRFFHNRPFYKLCCSSYAKFDDYKLGCYSQRHFKWGYFTSVTQNSQIKDLNIDKQIKIMWCGRFLKLKHPETAILLASKLKQDNYNIHIDFYGSGDQEETTKELAKKLGVENIVSFNGPKQNEEVIEEMRKHQIFLFTSDNNEGWGAVANEALSSGCALIASKEIGSTNYLVKDGFNGYSFNYWDIDGLTTHIKFLLDNPDKLMQLRKNALSTMQSLWNPQNAVNSFLILADSLLNKKEIVIENGPCSKA